MEEMKKENQISENIADETKKEMDDKKELGTETESRYDKLLDLEVNLWTYGSPVLFESGILEYDKISDKNRLTLKFTNIYKKDIRELNITVSVSDDEGNVENIEHNYGALGLKYLETKGSAAKITIPNKAAGKYVIQVNYVTFEDGTIWQKQDSIYESVGELEDVEVFAEAKLKDYEDSYISATEDISKDDSVHIGNGIEILKRISWYLDAKVLLKDAKRKYSIVKQNEERKQASEDRRANRKKAVRKRYIVAAIAVGVIAVIAAVVVFAFIIPNNKYKAAKKLMNDKKYDKAVTAFEELNGFMKSEEYLAEANYNLGLAALSDGDEDKAADYFVKGHDADKDSTHGKMAGAFLDYYDGAEALQKENYEEAMKLFKSSANAASDFNLINKASAGMAEIYYLQKDYETAWNTIKNVYAKDTSYEAEYGTYGYGYAKYLVDKGDTKNGMSIYNSVAKYTKAQNLNESVYNQAVKLGEQGKISEAMKLLESIRKNYKQANTLYKKMNSFSDKVQYWIGTWRHKGTVNGEKKTYRIKISQVLYKGEMCLRIIDKNNDYLGFDTIISSKNRVTQIQIGTYQLHFKLKKYHDQKFTYTLKGGKKMIRELKYDGQKYTSKYKK
ncbi:lipopolysaccharide assembly protein LapB [uncultured Eubacterium sp.]|uniref:tetratricopeptide repeat protein n=1 Tax=uncultured Eubacterium sp. TaxID=165185 RepID=UPI002671D574|nr:hypothetical protein [uncultured Eubacterium sp.]